MMASDRKLLFTPGPWKKIRLNGRWHIAALKGRLQLATVTELAHAPTTQVNADLISASPDLFRIVTAITELFDEHGHPANSEWPQPANAKFTAIVNEARKVLSCK